MKFDIWFSRVVMVAIALALWLIAIRMWSTRDVWIRGHIDTDTSILNRLEIEK